MSELATTKQDYTWRCTEAVSQMASILPDNEILEVLDGLRGYIDLLTDAVKSRKPKEINSWE